MESGCIEQSLVWLRRPPSCFFSSLPFFPSQKNIRWTCYLAREPLPVTTLTLQPTGLWTPKPSCSSNSDPPVHPFIPNPFHNTSSNRNRNSSSSSRTKLGSARILHLSRSPPKPLPLPPQTNTTYLHRPLLRRDIFTRTSILHSSKMPTLLLVQHLPLVLPPVSHLA
jgi:hypothetical protein